jgi:hypothetical protein
MGSVTFKHSFSPSKTVLARKPVKQSFHPSERMLGLMQTFKDMTNVCAGIGLENDVSTLRRLSLLAYKQFGGFCISSYYKLCAVSRARGILASRKKSLRRGYPTKDPYVQKLTLVSCYGFKIEDGSLFVPVGDREYERIPLVSYTIRVLSDPTLRVRSFTLTERSLSLCVSKDVEEMDLWLLLRHERNSQNRPSHKGDSRFI